MSCSKAPPYSLVPARKKMVKLWSSPADLGSVVSRSLVKLTKTDPAIGWVKADLLPDKSLTEENLQLRKQIDKINKELEESRKENGDLNLPYWRTLKADGYLNDKFPGGAESHKKLLENEGFKVISKGKRFYVENYQNHLISDF